MPLLRRKPKNSPAQAVVAMKSVTSTFSTVVLFVCFVLDSIFPVMFNGAHV